MPSPRPGQTDASGTTARQTDDDAASNSSSRDSHVRGDGQEEPVSNEDNEGGYDFDDDDDDYGDDDDDETSSNYSSVTGDSLPPLNIYGHSYHGSGRIYIPHDADEDERLRLQHELYKLCLDGRLHDVKLPIEDEQEGNRDGGRGGDEKFHILDVGSGNGLWALDVARRYPSADVLGVDISSAMLPKDVPANLTFEIADVAEPWPPRLYDFIHIRNLAGGGVRDWDRLLTEALAHLKPGGALEFSEIRPRFYGVDAAGAPDLSEGCEAPVIGQACLEYERLFYDLARREGVNFDPVRRVSEWLAESEAEALRERVDWLPVAGAGNDPIMRKKGEILARMIEVGLESWTMMLFYRSGRGEAETRALLERVKEETISPELRSYFNLTFITARKPITAGPVQQDAT
ncbi:Malonyl-[acyl-carrier protein] O-methyltransferase-like protein [Hapsidospora chrysogenum ATCC 11550]|uniref:Malonyl-[acyl-carrier protein] O-methyltransferase-like protein n=1 Tax=Hapsidospora chrysogenum (strain ATCC 11550 / CBS 779.69 / DSM 880 / IAM 14645 / JCM 23072 / IMI 49137) TaxID=857340 RepID=A0A086T858_HAPC1|nr:Malonyl-[acyl-carrier protein] O-methyltransferase-like protein [Hapsidospora chrysogenum ATCC 11550]